MGGIYYEKKNCRQSNRYSAGGYDVPDEFFCFPCCIPDPLPERPVQRGTCHGALIPEKALPSA